MNESQTRLDKIDPALHSAGWSRVEDSRIITEHPITNGRISKTSKPKPLKADYILSYKGAKLAVIEAKKSSVDVTEGVAQAKRYADLLNIRYTYATNGDKIYAIDMLTGEEGEIETFPSPDELWAMTFGDVDEWRDKFYAQSLYSNGTKTPRYYQELAINKTLEAIAKGRNRILLTLATGTGKTFIAFQICYKLFHTKWNVKKTGNRPRILFLADRNILANQAFNGFFGFSQDALVRITPDSIKKKGKVPTNGSVFFTIFQTFMTDDGKKYIFGNYPRDFFDLIIIDECHRGGANDESSWREILNYFSSAVQIGLTATPRRDLNVNTYKYFGGEPVYQYSLKQGIADGFLTPFRHSKMQGTIDDYIYSPEDEILSGEVEEGKVYTEEDFYRGNIKIKQRDFSRVKEFLKYIGEDEKTLVFCATQNHAGHIRDMINQIHKRHPNYAVRVTANDGAEGERLLKVFQDNEKTIPTILTTSQKLSTGVDALNVRNIVLMRPIRSMIEFKQIIGRGTRLYDGKYYFTIYDFVKAYENFQDPTWDGDPVYPISEDTTCLCEPETTYGDHNEPTGEIPEPEPTCENPKVCLKCGQQPCVCEKPQKLEIRLSEGRTRKIKYLKSDMFWDTNGKPVSTEEFLSTMFGQMPQFFNTIEELQTKWSDPTTREILLDKMDEAGYGKEVLKQIRILIDAENSDLLDVLEYISFNVEPIERSERVKRVENYMLTLSERERDFVGYLKNLYIKEGVEELGIEKLPSIIAMKYGSILDGMRTLGNVEVARNTFLNFQRKLYSPDKIVS